MIHVSDMSWTRKINHPSEVMKKGDVVEAVVLEVDRPNQRIALGMKQLGTDPWANMRSFTRWATSSAARSPNSRASARSAACNTRSTVWCISRRFRRSHRQDQERTQGRPGRERARRQIDKGERRIGLSIKAASYTDEQLKEEQKILDQLKPGEDLVALQHAFDAADEAVKPE